MIIIVHAFNSVQTYHQLCGPLIWVFADFCVKKYCVSFFSHMNVKIFGEILRWGSKKWMLYDNTCQCPFDTVYMCRSVWERSVCVSAGFCAFKWEGQRGAAGGILQLYFILFFLFVFLLTESSVHFIIDYAPNSCLVALILLPKAFCLLFVLWKFFSTVFFVFFLFWNSFPWLVDSPQLTVLVTNCKMIAVLIGA